MLTLILRGTRQRALGQRVLAGAAAAWQTLQPAGTVASSSGGGLADNSHSSGRFDSCSWLCSAGGLGGSSSSFSSSTVVASSSGECNSSSSSSSSKGKSKGGRRRETTEPQPRLQAWLQQEQGLPAKAADQHARRLALVFGSQQAALDSLPATFEWCRSRGLTGLQTVQLLDDIANKRRENVAQFTALVQPVWQQLDSYIAAWDEQQLQAGGGRLRKHTSLAEVLCSKSVAAQALGMPPGHVEAWLAAVGEQLSAAAIGGLLLTQPHVVTGSPATALAAISWATDVLGITDPAAFLVKAPSLLTCEVPTVQRKLDSLQQALGWTAQQARQLVLKQPALLSSSPATAQAALAWLRQLFPDAEQLTDVIDRGPQLLACSVQHLQGNADYMRQALGWQDGDGQLAAFVAACPARYATTNLSDEETQHKLRLLSEVVGISVEQCLRSSISYLNRRLENIAARYMLVQERAPALLRIKGGELCLSWIIHANQPDSLRRLGMTRDEFNAFVRGWPASAQGQRLLEGLRAGSVEGWPRPPSREEAQQRQQAAEAEQQRTGKASATTAEGKQTRVRRNQARSGGSSGGLGDAVDS